MPELTTNLGLEKPLGNETADIAVINSNMDKVDGEITKKASTTEDGRMSKEDKTKLDGVEDNANNYQHPAAHAPSVITQDANNRFVTDAEKATWNAKETPSGAQTKVNVHANKTDNPHSVTKAQVGLGSVDNVKQATKAEFDAHVGDGGKHPTALSQLNGDSTHRTVTDAEKAAWNGKLNAGAKAADSDKLDGIDSSQFVRNDRDNTINGNLAVNGYVQAKGFVSDTTDTVRVMFPSGGAYRTFTSNVTGAIKITLPVSWTNTMLRFTVKMFEYTSGESFDVTVGGYNYITGSRWANTSAYIIGDAGINRDFTVRFGHDGSKCCVYIGEISSTWSYPQVTVTDFECGFSGISNEIWNDGWDVSFASSFGTISSTITGTQVGRTVDGNIVWHAGNDGSGSGLDADKLDGLHESTFMRKSANSDLDMNNRVIREVGQIQLTDANTRIDEGANNAVRIQTNKGYVDIGPANSSHCHFYTDRPRFYFDRNLGVRGEIYAGSSYNQKVWHQGNDGAGSGLDADLLRGKNFTELGFETIAGSKKRIYSSSLTDPVYHTSYSPISSCVVVKNGTVRVGFVIGKSGGVGRIYGRIYVNGIARGEVRSNSTSIEIRFWENISVNAGDVITIYGKKTDSASGYIGKLILSVENTDEPYWVEALY